MSKVKYYTDPTGATKPCRAKDPQNCRFHGTHTTRAEIIVEQNKLKETSDPFQDVVNQLDAWEDAHYRLYFSKTLNKPVVINVQYFDYLEYDNHRFLDSTAYKNEEEAEVAAEKFNDNGEYVPRYLKQQYTKAEQIMHAQAGKDGYSAFEDVLDQLPDYSTDHYRVYLSPRTNKPVAINVQYFDYYDYKGSRFLNQTAYLNEEEAEKALTEYAN